MSPISIITELQDGSEDELRNLTATSSESVGEIETFSTADAAPQVKVGRKSPTLQLNLTTVRNRKRGGNRQTDKGETTTTTNTSRNAGN